MYLQAQAERRSQAIARAAAAIGASGGATYTRVTASLSNSSPILMAAELAWTTSMGSCRTCVKARSWREGKAGVIVRADGVTDGRTDVWEAGPDHSLPAAPPRPPCAPRRCSTSQTHLRRRRPIKSRTRRPMRFYERGRYLWCTCRPCWGSSGRGGSRQRGFSCARPCASAALSRSSMSPAVNTDGLHPRKRSSQVVCDRVFTLRVHL